MYQHDVSKIIRVQCLEQSFLTWQATVIMLMRSILRCLTASVVAWWRSMDSLRRGIFTTPMTAVGSISFFARHVMTSGLLAFSVESLMQQLRQSPSQRHPRGHLRCRLKSLKAGIMTGTWLCFMDRKFHYRLRGHVLEWTLSRLHRLDRCMQIRGGLNEGSCE